MNVIFNRRSSASFLCFRIVFKYGLNREQTSVRKTNKLKYVRECVLFTQLLLTTNQLHRRILDGIPIAKAVHRVKSAEKTAPTTCGDTGK